MTVPPIAQSALSEQELFARNVKDVFFDYDKYTIRADQELITESDAKFLEQHPSVSIVAEGHCDDRGSDEYNLALGASRANAVKEATSEGRRKRRPHQNGELWQGKTVLHGGRRVLLVAEPARSHRGPTSVGNYEGARLHLAPYSVCPAFLAS